MLKAKRNSYDGKGNFPVRSRGPSAGYSVISPANSAYSLQVPDSLYRQSGMERNSELL